MLSVVDRAQDTALASDDAQPRRAELKPCSRSPGILLESRCKE